ncbi:MAG TPA: 5'-3' exonuclease H3TH domain-containing protein [Vicinamibacterales bacterium]|nr:5'-3' exonuclease H3TH domain-containing protein [Vicinamibacterales bacterium]
MNVHLVDGTYELFRHYYAVPPAQSADGIEVGAVRGVLSSVLSMLGDGATHVAVATDHVIESFRNELWRGYKTSEGIEPLLFAQFHPLEDALQAMGVVVLPQVDFEADDGLAAGAAVAAADPLVERVFICTPDKDLAQAVVGTRVVQLDRRARQIRDEASIVRKFGVPPASIPDYLALVGDSADGYPGLPGWGPKSASTVLSHYGHFEAIPERPADWAVTVRGAATLGATLTEYRPQAFLFREIATLRTDAPVFDSVDAIHWAGPRPDFETVAARLGAPLLFKRAQGIALQR